MKRLGVVVPGVVALVCGGYAVIYLARWEWNRAIIAALFFVAAEVVVVATLLLARLRRLEDRLADLADRPAPAAPAVDPAPALDDLRAAAPPPGDHFAWLRESARHTNVFLPVLLGAGVLASALAWAVEHVARATLTPVRERRLADSLGVLRPPVGLLAPLAPAPVRATPARRLALGVVAAAATGAAGLGAVGAVDWAADRLQTRTDAHVAGAETVIELELLGAIASDDPARVLGHLWATCTGPDVFRARTLPPPDVDHRPGGVVHVRVAAHVGEHAMARLRGCLNDTTLDRVQARVVRAEVAAPSPRFP